MSTKTPTSPTPTPTKATAPKVTAAATAATPSRPATAATRTSTTTTAAVTRPSTATTAAKTSTVATPAKTTAVATTATPTRPATATSTRPGTATSTTAKTSTAATPVKATAAATSAAKTTAVATAAKTTAVATAAKTTAVATAAKTTAVATAAKTTAVATAAKTTAVATAAKTTAVATAAKTTAVATASKTTTTSTAARTTTAATPPKFTKTVCTHRLFQEHCGAPTCRVDGASCVQLAADHDLEVACSHFNFRGLCALCTRFDGTIVKAVPIPTKLVCTHRQFTNHCGAPTCTKDGEKCVDLPNNQEVFCTHERFLRLCSKCVVPGTKIDNVVVKRVTKTLRPTGPPAPPQMFLKNPEYSGLVRKGEALYFGLNFLGLPGANAPTTVSLEEAKLGLGLTSEQVSSILKWTAPQPTISTAEFFDNLQLLLRLPNENLDILPEVDRRVAIAKLDERLDVVMATRAELQKEVDRVANIFAWVDTDYDEYIDREDFRGVLDKTEYERFFEGRDALAFTSLRKVNDRDRTVFHRQAWKRFGVFKLTLDKNWALELQEKCLNCLTAEERNEIWRLYSYVDPHDVGSFSENDCIKAFGPVEGYHLYRYVFDDTKDWAAETLRDQANRVNRANAAATTGTAQVRTASTRNIRDPSYIPLRIAKARWEVPFLKAMDDLVRFRRAVEQMAEWYAEEQKRNRRGRVEVIENATGVVELSLAQVAARPAAPGVAAVATRAASKTTLARTDCGAIYGGETACGAAPCTLKITYNQVSADLVKLHSVMKTPGEIHFVVRVCHNVPVSGAATASAPTTGAASATTFTTVTTRVNEFKGYLKNDSELVFQLPSTHVRVVALEIEVLYAPGPVAWKDIRLISLQQPTPHPVLINIEGVTHHGSRSGLIKNSTDRIEDLKKAYEIEVNRKEGTCRWTLTEFVWDGEYEMVSQSGFGSAKIRVPRERTMDRELFEDTLDFNHISEYSRGDVHYNTIKTMPVGPLTQKLAAEKKAKQLARERERARMHAATWSPNRDEVAKTQKQIRKEIYERQLRLQGVIV
eukprot:gnl/Spiro4/10979_TR5824_c0_g16_i1.p1 gnl/Spiro4/10979_TR5824_c0_g16~~gnl/Spiro4/10979_TR5824_c0_g16_i1.p1  ORF type:complete len:1043 (+),score=280.95 gnl/Spiro4/10979_TR5824_c0_g16_i1:56-3184(+)